MTRGVDVVVRGRITGTRLMAFGAFAGDAGHAQIVFGVVTVDEILKGAPELHEGTIEIAGLGWTEIPPEDLPEHEHVFFVVEDAVVVPEAGVTPRDWGIHSYYARPNGYQAVLRDIGGKIRLINGPRGWQEAFGPFPSGLDGDVFDDVVERIRVIVREAQ